MDEVLIGQRLADHQRMELEPAHRRRRCRCSDGAAPRRPAVDMTRGQRSGRRSRPTRMRYLMWLLAACAPPGNRQMFHFYPSPESGAATLVIQFTREVDNVHLSINGVLVASGVHTQQITVGTRAAAGPPPAGAGAADHRGIRGVSRPGGAALAALGTPCYSRCLPVRCPIARSSSPPPTC